MKRSVIPFGETIYPNKTPQISSTHSQSTEYNSGLTPSHATTNTPHRSRTHTGEHTPGVIENAMSAVAHVLRDAAERLEEAADRMDADHTPETQTNDVATAAPINATTTPTLEIQDLTYNTETWAQARAIPTLEQDSKDVYKDEIDKYKDKDKEIARNEEEVEHNLRRHVTLDIPGIAEFTHNNGEHTKKTTHNNNQHIAGQQLDTDHITDLEQAYTPRIGIYCAIAGGALILSGLLAGLMLGLENDG